MKGNWPSFSEPTNGNNTQEDGCINGIDYNTAGSSNVSKVDSIQTVSNQHSLPKTSSPNSVIKNYKDGKLVTERYYGEDGNPYLDIDYSDHGNPKMHPNVPHEHLITFKDGEMNRAKTDGRIE